MTARPPQSPEITLLVREAITATRSGDRGRANALFRRVTQHEPHNEAAWLWFANTADQPADAVAGLRNALRLNPKNTTAAAALPASLLRAGIAATKAGDRGAAAEYLAGATEVDPTNEAAWLWRAGVTDDADQAVGFLERVLRLNPDNAHAKQGIAQLKAQLAPVWQCPLCGRTPERDDTISDSCGRCGAIVDLYRPEQFDTAVPGLDRAALEASVKRLRAKWATDPKPDVGFALGLAYLNLGQAAEAMPILQTVAHRSPNPDRREEIARLVRHRNARAATTATQRIGPPATRPDFPGLPEKPRPAPQPRIMVVDDSATVRRMVSMALRGAGYQVVEATDADHAAQVVREVGPPQLFLLDVNMPGTDGFGLCKHLRADAETARVPVVFLTGKTGLLSKIHGRWVGAAEYLTKPFDPAKLIATVAKLVPTAK